MANAPRETTSVLIVFLDLSRFKFEAARREDAEIAAALNAFYRLVAREAAAGGGRVVKFIGDAALVVFPESAIDAAARTLRHLRRSVDEFFIELGWGCRFSARAHFGPVVAGEFGPPGDERFDIIGRAVNKTAMIQANGVTLSHAAWRRLSPEGRSRFQLRPK